MGTPLVKGRRPAGSEYVGFVALQQELIRRFGHDASIVDRLRELLSGASKVEISESTPPSATISPDSLTKEDVRKVIRKLCETYIELGFHKELNQSASEYRKGVEEAALEG